jgi:4-amino-4-deoxy-L-arabinose transferase-like glycosyltransferase
MLVPLGIVCLAFALRIVYIAWVDHWHVLFANPDAHAYHLLAVNLLARGVFSMAGDPPFVPAHVWGPLYPLFVAAGYLLTGPVPQAIPFYQALLDSLTVAVTYQLGQWVGGRRVGLLAALLYALYPSTWRFSNELLTEILFGLLVTTALWMLVRYVLAGRRRDLALFALFAGLATLCKSQGLLLVVTAWMVAIYELVKGRRSWWQTAAVVPAIVAALLLPWIVRNRVVFGRWFYTTTFQYNLSVVSAVATLAHARGESVAPWTPRWWAIYDEIWNQARERSGWAPCDESRTLCQGKADLRDLTAVSLQTIRAYPLDLVGSHVKGWLRSFVPQEHRFWYGRFSGQSWSKLSLRGDALGRALDEARQGRLAGAARLLVRERLLALPPLALGFWLGWAAMHLIVIAAFCVGAWWLRPRILSLVFCFVVFYVTFLPGPISHVRFRLPVMPTILVVAGVGVLSLVRLRA